MRRGKGETHRGARVPTRPPARCSQRSSPDDALMVSEQRRGHNGDQNDKGSSGAWSVALIASRCKVEARLEMLQAPASFGRGRAHHFAAVTNERRGQGGAPEDAEEVEAKIGRRLQIHSPESCSHRGRCCGLRRSIPSAWRRFEGKDKGRQKRGSRGFYRWRGLQ
jgi:hypothetical protein